ncbi:DUF4190 domain-containing protein [Amycolatopsis sp. NBC_00438]|uniref:DUF4190 domain-containing protein n=1 Tax=Amycolatopsis sp. NBC_00438 TaxID=2903558 RepID=UPI002E1AA90B
MTETDIAAPAKRDGFAVASLATGVLGFFGITALLGLVFGIVALVRIHRSGERGRGFAIGGIAASVAWAIAVPVAAVLLLAALASSSNAPILAMQVDDCYNVARPAQDAAKVSCDGDHDGLLLDSFTMAGPQVPYPGDRKVRDSALSVCSDRLKSLLEDAGAVPAEPMITGYGPDEAAWAKGSRTAMCGFESHAGSWRGN